MYRCDCDKKKKYTDNPHKCQKHRHCRKIIAGPTGPTGPNGSNGPTGPIGPSKPSAYMYTYNNCTSQNINSCNGTTGTLVNFNSTPVINNINFNGVDTVTIVISGDYEVNYTVNDITSDPSGIISFKLLKNGITVDGSVYSQITTPTISGTVIGQVKFSAVIGDTIQLVSNNTTPTVINPFKSPFGNKTSVSGTINSSFKSFITPPITIEANSSVYVCVSTKSCNLSIIKGPTPFKNDITATFNKKLDKVSIYHLDELSHSFSYFIEITILGTDSGIINNYLNGTYNIKVYNILKTANSSNDVIGAVFNGTSTNFTSTLVPTTPNELSLMACSITQPGTLSTLFPNILLDKSPTDIDIAQILGPIGSYNLTASNNNQVEGAAVSVAIKFADNTSFCDCPVFSSLDIKLL